jgi:hypothetical protein
LKSDHKRHADVLPVLTDRQLVEFQQKADFIGPGSFVVFLKEFGSGAKWLYQAQAMDSAAQPSRLSTYRRNLPGSIELFEGGSVPKDSLLCLMTEDSNGGAWCWLTSLRSPDGECPLAYWDASTGKLHFKLDSFTDWLRILVTYKGEVIRALDKDERLQLG